MTLSQYYEIESLMCLCRPIVDEIRHIQHSRDQNISSEYKERKLQSLLQMLEEVGMPIIPVKEAIQKVELIENEQRVSRTKSIRKLALEKRPKGYKPKYTKHVTHTNINS